MFDFRHYVTKIMPTSPSRQFVFLKFSWGWGLQPPAGCDSGSNSIIKLHKTLHIQPWRIGQFRHHIFNGTDPPELVDRNPEDIVRRKWEDHEH
jgi:hypothetical protein